MKEEEEARKPSSQVHETGLRTFFFQLSCIFVQYSKYFSSLSVEPTQSYLSLQQKKKFLFGSCKLNNKTNHESDTFVFVCILCQVHELVLHR